MHKGFKCLDIAEGCIYISRDVVFDEDVYPFSKLHPNARARLRSKILLLPTSLRNPFSAFGDNNTVDTNGNDSMHTNMADENAGSVENQAQNGENFIQNAHHFMSPSVFPFLATTCIYPGGDHPVRTAEPAGGSASDQLHVSTSSQCADESGAAGAPDQEQRGQRESAPIPLPPRSSTAAPHAVAESRSRMGSSLPQGAGSSALADHVAPAHRPATRLQHGIRKPKVYTDGTIRYGQLIVSSEEPPTLKYALADKN
jgi:hypothetical protein